MKKGRLFLFYKRERADGSRVNREKGKGKVGSRKLVTRGKQNGKRLSLFVEEKQEKRSVVLWSEGTDFLLFGLQ